MTETREIEVRAMASLLDEMFAEIIEENNLSDDEVRILSDQSLFTFGYHYINNSDKELDEAVINASYIIQDTASEPYLAPTHLKLVPDTIN